MRSKWLVLLLCIRLLLLPSAARCSSLPWSKRPHDQSLGLGLKKNVAGCRLACSQNKWYSDPTDASIGARLCVGCALSGGLGVTRVALNRRTDAGRLMAQLASAFSYCCMPQLGLSRMYHRELGVRGVFSVVCYAVLCPWSGGLSGLLFLFMPWSSV